MFYFLSIILSLLALVYANALDSGRIINGHDVSEGKYPFIVSLQYGDNPCNPIKAKGHFCAGSVINDNTILTVCI